MDLENQRIGLKVNKENNEIFNLFNDIKGHNVREPEQRFIGEVSRLVASKWGLNGNLGYKVPYPHIPPDKNPYRKIVVNLNEPGRPGGVVKEHPHAHKYEDRERRMFLPSHAVIRMPYLKRRKKMFPLPIMSGIPLKKDQIYYNEMNDDYDEPMRRTLSSNKKPYVEHYWSAVVSPDWFSSQTAYRDFLHSVHNDFNDLDDPLSVSINSANKTQQQSRDRTIEREIGQPSELSPAKVVIETGDRKNLIFKGCGDFTDAKLRWDCLRNNRSKYPGCLIERCTILTLDVLFFNTIVFLHSIRFKTYI